MQWPLPFKPLQITVMNFTANWQLSKLACGLEPSAARFQIYLFSDVLHHSLLGTPNGGLHLGFLQSHT